MLHSIKEPVSCLSHLLGAVAAVFCTVALIRLAAPFGALHVTAFAVFGASLIMLYSASAIYHMLRVGEKVTRVLRRIDHTMIFFLIAGTYTPVCLLVLPGAWGTGLLIAIWALAFLGAGMKLFWLHAPRMLSTAIYVIMGWLVLIAFYPLLKAISTGAFMLLLLGGLSYTLGAVIYALKWPPLPFRHLGFHEVFHLFVLLGSAFHVIFMFRIHPQS